MTYLSQRVNTLMRSEQLLRLHQDFAEQGIILSITKKSVKNINFRMKAGECHVSVPRWASERAVIEAVRARLSWVFQTHHKLQQKAHFRYAYERRLWGESVDLPADESQILRIYRQALSSRLPDLIAKWQPIVGRVASEVRLKKMKTRWGTCNTREGRVWLSVYLAAYPYECTEYVFVHELCHLIHANHSPLFWAEVKKAMPDYKKWHDLLKARDESL